MISSLQSRTKRYKHQVFTKLTDEQNDWLFNTAAMGNRKIAEVLRDLVQAAKDSEESIPKKASNAGDTVTQELLTAIRMEVLTLGDCLLNNKRVDIAKLCAEAEEVAAVDLAAFKDRLVQRLALMNLLNTRKDEVGYE